MGARKSETWLSLNLENLRVTPRSLSPLSCSIIQNNFSHTNISGRTFFPPIPTSPKAQEPTDKVKSMPSPPTIPPTSLTSPPPKKQKLSDDSDWEAVSAAGDSAINGLEDDVGLETGRLRSTSIDEDVMTQEKKEEQNAALHTAQTGGDPPQSMLEKDW